MMSNSCGYCLKLGRFSNIMDDQVKRRRYQFKQCKFLQKKIK